MPKKKRPGPKPRLRPVPRALTERREAFCREFLVDYNGTKAAIRAGYSQKGAAQTAWLLLRNAKVRAAVAHAIEVADGKIVRFDQYVDSATINAAIGA